MRTFVVFESGERVVLDNLEMIFVNDVQLEIPRHISASKDVAEYIKKQLVSVEIRGDLEVAK